MSVLGESMIERPTLAACAFAEFGSAALSRRFFAQGFGERRR
jgi:hypothetical protein